jgi:hypothetical protein
MLLATAFVTLPFVAREVIPTLEEIGSEQEEATKILEPIEKLRFYLRSPDQLDCCETTVAAIALVLKIIRSSTLLN